MPRRRKGFDLRRQPGFNEAAWLCLFVLYALFSQRLSRTR